MNTAPSASPIQFDVKVFLMFCFRYWYLIAIGLVGGLSYAYYQLRYTPATYSVNARMLVKD